VCGYNHFDLGLQTIRIAASARAGHQAFASMPQTGKISSNPPTQEKI
jgi:hypothetical protein